MICCRPEVDDDVISGPNVKTIESYRVLNFEIVSSSSFQDIKQDAHQLVGRQNAATLEFDPKSSEAAFRLFFFSLQLPTGSIY